MTSDLNMLLSFLNLDDDIECNNGDQLWKEMKKIDLKDHLFKGTYENTRDNLILFLNVLSTKERPFKITSEHFRKYGQRSHSHGTQ